MPVLNGQVPPDRPGLDLALAADRARPRVERGGESVSRVHAHRRAEAGDDGAQAVGKLVDDSTPEPSAAEPWTARLHPRADAGGALGSLYL